MPTKTTQAKKQSTINQFFAPMPSVDPGQTLLTKFFQSSNPEENKFQYLFEREEARRKKLEQEEQERIAKLKEEERQRKRELKKKRQEEKERQFALDQEKRWEEERLKYEGKPIVPGLYLGSRHAAKNFEWIEGNITAILNMSVEVKNYHEGRFITPLSRQDSAQPTEDAMVDQPDQQPPPVPPALLVYKRVVCEDAAEQNLTPFWSETSEFIESVVTQGGAVLVHCREGLSRSPSTVIAYLMTKSKWSLEKAYQHVLNCNRKLRINDGFQRQLMEYEVHLFGTSSMDFFNKRSRTTRSSCNPPSSVPSTEAVPVSSSPDVGEDEAMQEAAE